MASFVFDSFWGALQDGSLDSGTVKCILVNGAAPNRGTHADRADITTETTGTGYTAGGAVTAVTSATDTGLHTHTLTFAGNTWSASSLTATGAVYYLSTGTASTDTLLLYNEFPAPVVSAGGNFALTPSTLRLG